MMRSRHYRVDAANERIAMVLAEAKAARNGLRVITVEWVKPVRPGTYDVATLVAERN